MELLKRLILYIIDQIQDQEGIISKIRIVKLLYLIDVEHYRTYGKTLTGLEWIFYRYGPYAFAIDSAVRQLGFDLGEEEVTTAAGYPAYVYRVEEPQSLEDIVSFAVQSMIDRKIKQWALEDTRFLLDYVYTATEPMQQATFGQKLDFSKIQRGLDTHRPARHLKIAADKSAVIQKLLKDRRELSWKQKSPQPQYDELYFEAMNLMDQEEKRGRRIIGKAEISPESAEAISRQVE
jgi:hypothetical protein